MQSPTHNAPRISPRLCLVTALAAETRPLLDTFRFSQCSARHLRLWQSEHLMLLETGLGKLNAAAATAALLQAFPDVNSLLNIGIAGGAFPYGQALLAHHVKDAATGAQWYPHLPDAKCCRNLSSASLLTVDKPDTNYLNNTVFDMEAAGVLSAASHYLSSSQVQCIKVVSDNPQNPLEKLDKNVVSQLLGAAMSTIVPVITHLQQTAFIPATNQLKAINQMLNDISDLAHHSVNDRQLLRELLQRHYNISGALPQLPQQIKSASALRAQLQVKLGQLPFAYQAT